MQYAHLFASIGISDRHSLHFLFVGSTGDSFLDRAMSIFIGLTIKKNIADATKRKEIKALIKCPYLNSDSLIVNERELKSGSFAMADTSGVSKSDTKADTTVPKAAPMTTPTAKSTTFPLSKNCLNSFNI